MAAVADSAAHVLGEVGHKGCSWTGLVSRFCSPRVPDHLSATLCRVDEDHTLRPQVPGRAGRLAGATRQPRPDGLDWIGVHLAIQAPHQQVDPASLVGIVPPSPASQLTCVLGGREVVSLPAKVGGAEVHVLVTDVGGEPVVAVWDGEERPHVQVGDPVLAIQIVESGALSEDNGDQLPPVGRLCGKELFMVGGRQP